ncbi:MAG: cell division protein FtsZ [Myxococcales bacterium]|nr:MAG: cell division protein FtsZ [Myxococcales bacterium]
MAISIDFADESVLQAQIKVVGVGGEGGNALSTMIADGLDGVDFVVANTDTQALENHLAASRIQLGPNLTKGLGAGADPDIGRKSALEDVQQIAEALQGADMVFVTAGMGGGTGTGAAPIIAQIARDQGALTVGVVTKPFLFEGRRRGKNAERGIEELTDAVDTIITIPNEKLLNLADEDMPLLEAFRKADDVLLQAVRGISDLIVSSGMINVDFADVRTIMSSTGRALMGTGVAKGERRAIDAADMAINSPLLDDVTIEGSTGILLNFTAGPDIRLKEINEAASYVQQAAHEDANIIFGVVTDPNMSDVVKVTVIATGFDGSRMTEAQNHYPGRISRPMGTSKNHGHGAQLPLSAARSSQSERPQRMNRQTMPSMPAVRQQESHSVRAFGADALLDEALLEIPAYMRRGQRNG